MAASYANLKPKWLRLEPAKMTSPSKQFELQFGSRFSRLTAVFPSNAHIDIDPCALQVTDNTDTMAMDTIATDTIAMAKIAINNSNG